MSHDTAVGLILWAVLLYPVWSPRCRRIRKTQRTRRASPSTRVSRNSRQTGPLWEQDAPYPECFEEDDL